MPWRIKWREKFRYAARGIGYAFKADASMAVHLMATIVVLTAGVLLRLDTARLAVLVVTCALVLSLEMVNTAIESLVRGHVSEPSECAGHALDVCAGAVLIATIGAVVVGLLIFGERIIEIVRAGGVP